MATAFDDATSNDFREGKARVQKETITGVSTKYYSVRPGRYTVVQLNKGGSTATLKATSDFAQNTNVDDAEFSTLEISSGTDDYHNGHSTGITGFEVDLTAYVGNCVVVITEYALR